MKVVPICFLIGLFLMVFSQAFAEQPEILLGISTNFYRNELTIEVVSSGCTSKRDFTFDLKDNILTITRMERDVCKAMPQKIRLTYSLSEIGINPHQPFSISNKFIVNENIANIK